jgi:hypothetical protein
MVINVDMVGRGGHGWILSDTAALAAYDNPGQPPYYLQIPEPQAAEHAGRAGLEQAFADRGFVQHPTLPGYVITSDNLVFQNDSIPCLGVMQVDAKGAAALQAIERARQAWVAASKAIDWEQVERLRTGQGQPAAQVVAELKAKMRTLVDAWSDYLTQRRQQRAAPTSLIHNAGDRVERVNPQMGTRFAQALAEFAQGWGAGGR